MNLLQQLFDLGLNTGLAVLSIALVSIAYVINDKSCTAFKTTEAIMAGNMAAAVRVSGMALGLLLAFVGFHSTSGADTTPLGAYTELGLEGLVMVGLMVVSGFISNALILPSIKNDEQVRDGNTSVALVEFGTYVATGLIAWGSFSGDGGGIVSALVFFGLGQVCLLLVTKLYQWRTRFDLYTEIKGDNRTAAILLMGQLISMGLILRGALSGAFQDWTTDLVSFAAYAAVGYVALFIVAWFVDLVAIPVDTLEDIVEKKNAAPAVLTSLVVIGAAALLSVTLI